MCPEIRFGAHRFYPLSCGQEIAQVRLLLQLPDASNDLVYLGGGCALLIACQPPGFRFQFGAAKGVAWVAFGDIDAREKMAAICGFYLD
jgi:hypothetical protein